MHTHDIIFLKFSTIEYTSILQSYNWCLNLQPWQRPWQKLTKIFLCLQCKNLCTMFLAIGSPMSSIYAQHNLICGHSENCFINCTILTFCQCHLLEQLEGEMIRRLGATTHPCQGHRLFDCKLAKHITWIKFLRSWASSLVGTKISASQHVT